MSPVAIALVLVCALLPAPWNLSAKFSRPDESVFLLANATGALVALTLVWFLQLDFGSAQVAVA